MNNNSEARDKFDTVENKISKLPENELLREFQIFIDWVQADETSK